MADLSTQLIRMLSCKRVLEKADIQPTKEGGRLLTACLHKECIGPVEILGDEVLCTNRSCKFRSGNVVDFLATNTPYAEILHWLGKNFTSEVENLTTLPWPTEVEGLAEKFTAQRALFDFFLKRREPNTNIKPFPAFRERAFCPRACQGVVFHLTKEEVAQLRVIVERLTGQEVSEPEESDAIVVPYYADMVRISEVELNFTNGEVRRWVIFPMEIAYAGLLEVKQPTPNIFRNPFEAAIFLTRVQKLDWRTSAVVVRHKFGTSERTPLYLTGTYQLEPDESLATVSHLSEHSSDMLVAESSHCGDPQPWFDFINRRLNRWVELNDDVRLKKDLTALSMSPESRARWIGMIKDHFPDLYSRVKKHEGAEHTYEVRGAKITSTPKGYIVQKGRLLPSLATNFTVDLHRTIFFRDAPDLFHEGIVRFGGEEYPVLFSHKDLFSPRGIENAVLLADAKARPFGGNNTPTIPDKQLATPLTLLLSDFANKLRRIEGISSLGWTLDRGEFLGTCWRVDGSGLRAQDTQPHPTLPILKNFDFLPAPQYEDVNEAPPEVLDVLALLAALQARHFRGRPVIPVVFKSTKETQNTLKTLFRQLGQKTVIMLSYNLRGGYKELDTLGGYPALVAGMSVDMLEKCSAPVFLLAEVGRELGPLDDAKESAAFLHQKFMQVVAWILSTGGLDLPFCADGEYEDSLLREGYDILHHACDLDYTKPAKRFAHICRALSRVPDGSMHLLVKRHASGRLVWRTEGMKPEAVAELRAIDKTAAGDAYLTTDAATVEAQVGNIQTLSIDTLAPTDLEWVQSAFAS